MLILTFRILCVDKIGSRAAAACATSTTTTTTKISAPGRLQNVDFPPPALLVYETHNDYRLGKIESFFIHFSQTIFVVGFVNKKSSRWEIEFLEPARCRNLCCCCYYCCARRRRQGPDFIYTKNPKSQNQHGGN